MNPPLEVLSPYFDNKFLDPVKEFELMGIKTITVDDPLPEDVENEAGKTRLLSVGEFVNLLPSVGNFVEIFGFSHVLAGIKRQLVEGLIRSRWDQRQDRFVSLIDHAKCYMGALNYLRNPDIKIPYSLIQALTLELKYGIKEENYAWRYSYVMQSYKDETVSDEIEEQTRNDGNVVLVGAFAPVEVLDPYSTVGVWMRERVRNESSGEKWYSIPGGKANLEDIKTGEIIAIRELREETKLEPENFKGKKIIGIVDEVMINSKGHTFRYLGILATGVLFVDRTIFGDELKGLTQDEIDLLIREGRAEYARNPKPQNGDGNGDWQLLEPFVLRKYGLSPQMELEFAPITRLFMRNYGR